MILRVQKDKANPYLLVNTTGAKDETLSMQAKGLLFYLLSLPDDWQIYIKELTAHFTNGRDAIANTLQELIDTGYVERTQERSTGGKFQGYIYNVFEVPHKKKKVRKEPILPFPENPNTDNPKTENPTLLNNISNVNNNLTDNIADPSDQPIIGEISISTEPPSENGSIRGPRTGEQAEPYTNVPPTQSNAVVTTPEKEKRDFIGQLIDIFSLVYQENKGTNYIALGKDRKAMGTILGIYKKSDKNKGKTSDDTLNDFYNFFQACFTIEDDWIQQNLTLPFILNQFNKIKDILTNGTYRKRTSKGSQSKQELAEGLRNLYGDAWREHAAEFSPNGFTIHL